MDGRRLLAEEPSVLALAEKLVASGADGLSAQERREAAALLQFARDEKHRRGEFFDYYPEEGPFARKFYAKHLEHYRMGAHAKERCIMGGNRTGKTHANCFEWTCHASGRYPEWWPGRVFDEPIDSWLIGKTNQTTRDIVQEKLVGKIRRNQHGRHTIPGGAMLPLDWIVPEQVVFRTGFPQLIDTMGIRYKDSRSEFSTVGFKAYEQGRGSFEGTEKHYVGCDEEPPIDIYGECAIRTGTADGLIVVTFTPMEGMTATVIQFLSEELRPPDLVAANEENFLEY